jgi:hypothetical protein
MAAMIGVLPRCQWGGVEKQAQAVHNFIPQGDQIRQWTSPVQAHGAPPW